jgi:hypothetical protein
MKSFLKIFLFALLISSKAFGQAQAFAVSSISGILESKFIIGYNPDDSRLRSVNSVADTISPEEAVSILALEVIGMDTNKIMYKFRVKNFEMILQNANDTLTLKSDSGFLTDEMKNALKKIRPQTEIYFAYIRCHPLQGKPPSPASIKYYVR